jgi:hypothetical protein
MMKTVSVPVLMMAVATLIAAPAAAYETLSYEDLICRMIDLEQLAVLPAPGETCAQWSSWDRNSRYDDATGTYINWSANNDGPNFIRDEDGMVVMAEMEGPGCIWRIWSALAETGRVKIYLDGSDQPAVDLPFVNYFSGDTAPFDYPILSYDLAGLGCRGHNLYFPIPYQKSCKVLAEPGWGRYYQFVFTTYPKGTRIPTFSAALAAERSAALGKVSDFLENSLGTDPAGRRDGQTTESGTIRIAPGETVSMGLEGPRAITAIRGLMDFADRTDEMAALRKIVLKITWDGQQEPAVWCPLGDFSGTAPGVNLYRSLATGMTERGGYAMWLCQAAVVGRRLPSAQRASWIRADPSNAGVFRWNVEE